MKLFTGIDLRWLAVALALIGSVALAFGAQWQNDAVGEQQGKGTKLNGSLGLKQMLALVRRPRWLVGTGLLGLAVLFQISALSLAPLIVVQPLGAIALVVTSVLNARMSGTKLNRATIVAISLCVSGVFGFVVTASTIAKEYVLTDAQMWQVLGILAVILVALITVAIRKAKDGKAIYFVAGAGILYGFVATLTKVVIQRIYQGQFEWVTFLCLVVLGVAVSLGGWFVQSAYSSGPPDLVIAGLTVIDPMVAVLIAGTILGEANQASPLTIVLFLVFGATAIVGVLLLSQFHPQILLAKRRAAVWTKRRNYKR
jgi:drug/metabolite transporter (DMT)-like permease